MDHAVALVETYLRVNGYSAMSEYSDVEAQHYGWFRTARDLDILAFRFPGAGRLMPQSMKTNRVTLRIQYLVPGDVGEGAPRADPVLRRI